MLVTGKDLLDLAEDRGTAIGAFNVEGLASLQAILAAAENLNEPVMIAFAQTHESAGVMDLETIGPVMVQMAEASPVPVCVHLDHAVDLAYISRALQMGFTSVMYDGSSLPFEENIANAKMAVAIASQYGASVEAEIGMMSGVTQNENHEIEDRGVDRSMFTNPAQAKEFVARTGVDSLACAFGSVHGLYKAAPNLDFELVKELHDTIGAPVVMHGGSGVSDEDYKKVIAAGVRKINYYTYMVKAGAEALMAKINEMDGAFVPDITAVMRDGMQKDVERAMKVFVGK